LSLDLEKALEHARIGAKIACELMMLHYRGDYRVWNKEGAADRASEVLTEPDLLCDAALREHLGSLCRDALIVSEESAEPLSEGWHESEWIWFVDPIDGSLSYLEGSDNFGVSIALARRGKPLLGVLNNPARRLEAWAAAGLGAFLNGDRIAPSASPVESLRLIIGRSQRQRYSYRLLTDLLKPDDVFTLESVVTKTILLLQGEGEYYFSLPHEVFGGGCPSVWDLAGAAAIASEAGFAATDIYGDPLLFDGAETRWRKGFIFAHPEVYDKIHRELIRLIRFVEKRRLAGDDWG